VYTLYAVDTGELWGKIVYRVAECPIPRRRSKGMAVLSMREATDRLATAVESACSDRLAEIYEELFPNQPAPEVSGNDERSLAGRLAEHVRSGLEPEEVIDLWKVVFPTDRHVHYDEEGELVRYNEGEPWYSGR
jgi:hypothetical protein